MWVKFEDRVILINKNWVLGEGVWGSFVWGEFLGYWRDVWVGLFYLD